MLALTCSCSEAAGPASPGADCGPCAWPILNTTFGRTSETNTLVRGRRTSTGCSFEQKEVGELNISFRCEPLEVCTEGDGGLECAALTEVVSHGSKTYTRGDWEFWECVGCK